MRAWRSYKCAYFLFWTQSQSLIHHITFRLGWIRVEAAASCSMSLLASYHCFSLLFIHWAYKIQISTIQIPNKVQPTRGCPPKARSTASDNTSIKVDSASKRQTCFLWALLDSLENQNQSQCQLPQVCLVKLNSQSYRTCMVTLTELLWWISANLRAISIQFNPIWSQSWCHWSHLLANQSCAATWIISQPVELSVCRADDERRPLAAWMLIRRLFVHIRINMQNFMPFYLHRKCWDDAR